MRRSALWVRRPEKRPIPAFVRCKGMPSSVIRRFDYDPRAQALDVEFVSGRLYRYADVPAEVAEAFREAASKGRFFNARIRDHYPFKELTSDLAGDLWEL